jgi:acetyl-CoA carboxylase carboxyltransferase component
VNAVANSIVPKITIITGNSFGAGNYAMCGKAYDPRFIYAWPTAKIAVMGGEQAAKTMLQIQVAAMKAKGKEVSKEEEQALLEKITADYTKKTNPFYAASHLWVDAIIDPGKTRMHISEALSAANHNNEMQEFKTGVFQV